MREGFRTNSERLSFEEELRAAKEQAPLRHTLQGGSVLDYCSRPIDLSVNLLGNRWLSRLAGGFIVAPSGHGKSSLVMQMAICFSCGRACCGIKPQRPLRVFVMQAEDDDNDLIEMAQMLCRMNLPQAELALVRQNTHIEWLSDCTGDAFLRAADELLALWQADLLFINPYTAYQTEDIQDTAANAHFLRVGLSHLMAKYQLGCLNVHHTGKTQFQKKKDFAWFDWMYDMAGGAVLTNWARAVLIIAPSPIPGTYKFIAAKRFEKIGWREREYWFAHSVDEQRMLWIPANDNQIASAKAKEHLEPADLLGLIPLVDPIGQSDLIVVAKIKLKLGRDTTKAFIRCLLTDNQIKCIELPRKGTRPELSYVRICQ